MKTFFRPLAFAAFAALGLALLPSAFGQGSGSLDADLRQQFKPTKFAVAGGQLQPVDQGVILVVKKGGLRAYPPATLVLATNKVQDGNVETPRDNPFLGPSLLLPVDNRVYVMKVTPDVKKDRVIFIVMQCDQCNGAQAPSFFKAQIAFQFPQGWLAGADAGQVADAVAQVLVPENAGGDQDGGQQQQGNDQNAPPQQQQQAPPQQQAPQQTQTIAKGQTEEQVLAAFGQPDKIVDLGAKKLYIYKDMKITFIGGKVADVQ